MTPSQQERVWFDVRVTPNIALSRRGLILIGVGLLAPAAIFSGFMIALKAWPAGLFLGGEALLACAAIYWCGKRLAEQGERVVLTDTELVIESWDKGGVLAAERIEPTWARVERRTTTDFGCEAVFVRTRDKRVRVGSALSPAERSAFADALEGALHQRKTGFALSAA